MPNPAARDAALIDKLVTANRILAKYGIVDGFGHISVRAPAPTGDGDTFYLSRSLAPASVTAADVLRFDPLQRVRKMRFRQPHKIIQYGLRIRFGLRQNIRRAEN